jgi:hypothetical protein
MPGASAAGCGWTVLICERLPSLVQAAVEATLGASERRQVRVAAVCVRVEVRALGSPPDAPDRTLETAVVGVEAVRCYGVCAAERRRRRLRRCRIQWPVV